jgi:hypothetical protein
MTTGESKRDWFTRTYSLIHVPRYCDDTSVQSYLAAKFLTFRGRGANLTARGVVRAARRRFRERTDTLEFWEH